MIRSRSCLVIAAIIQIDLDKCCPIPNLYSDEVMTSCGFEKPPKNGLGETVSPKGPKTILPFCRDGLCLMRNANLLRANLSVDYEKLGHYIDQWAVAHPEYTKLILSAKPICTNKKEKSWRSGLPPDVCDQDRIYVCLNSRLLWNCYVRPYAECRRLQDYMNKCKQYYYKL